MAYYDSAPSVPLLWNFSQVLGQQLPNEPLQNDDIITTIAFDKLGDHLAVGDRGGRVVIFGRDDRKKNVSSNRRDLEQRDFASQHPEFRYKTEFQSHEPEFDYLKNVEIEEKINKVKEHKVKQVIEMAPPLCSENMLLAESSFVPGLETKSAANGYRLEWIEKMPQNFLPPQDVDSEIGGMEDPFRAKRQKVYAYAHSFNINSISNNSDYETFVSADDLRINLWNLEVSDQCFNIIDMKPSNMEDLTEVITSAEFHPLHCNLLAYSSSQGLIRLSDLRHSAICDHASRIFQHGESYGSKSFFTEITSSISDIKFLNDGQHLISRNYMNMKLWDMRKESSPVAIFKIHEHLRPKLPELYNNDCIFDKFECCFSGDGLHFATGSYSNILRIFSPGSGREEGIKLEIRGNFNRKAIRQPKSRARRSSLSNIMPRGIYHHAHVYSESSSIDSLCNLSSKLLQVAWHPTCNLVACAVESSLVLYYA
ncbi:serine/threonine protein phosphatase 2A 55 kDa regulatory subunit B beta isoform isoform X2 [Vigna radiata var. radiata]|uniref:Serine/threonine-protein phosphatase 2A 55 kDa regulatory subunit B n=1 Tax=Vigna radiata var. radiata TaxID=3916 RepID=A0A1S3U5F3_VIGRR|nr:serine/threonine protein phosphatase 2A 55 kDa regulatory subunit B beta isoform isoform X2 [Vigna radiata var. radiata]